MSGCECLILGPEGAGKTLLLKKLKRIVSTGKLSKDSVQPTLQQNSEAEDSTAETAESSLSEGVVHTLPTAGTNLEQLQIAKGLVCTLRECGGSTAPIWSSYYKHCTMIVYVIDSTNTTQISAATMLLLDILSAEDLQNKPVLVLFNKTDSHCFMSLTEFKSVMRFGDILDHATQSLQVVEVSCVTECGLDTVLRWIGQNTKQMTKSRR